VDRLLEAGVDGSFVLFKAAQSGDVQEAKYLADLHSHGATKHTRIMGAVRKAIESRDIIATRTLIRGLGYVPSTDIDDICEEITATNTGRPSTALANLFCWFNMVRDGCDEDLENGRIRYPINPIKPPSISDIINGKFWSTVSSKAQSEDIEVALLRSVSAVEFTSPVTFSCDGRYLGARGLRHVYVADMLHGKVSKLTWGFLFRDDGYFVPLCILADLRAFFSKGSHIIVSDFRSLSQGGNHRVFGSHPSQVTCLDVSRTAKILASASIDRWVCIWSIESENLLHKFKPNSFETPSSIALYPDGRWTAIGTDESVELWRVNVTKRDSVQFLESYRCYRRASFSSTGLLILSDRIYNNPFYLNPEANVCIWSLWPRVDDEGMLNGCMSVYEWSDKMKSSSVRVSSTSDGRWLGFGYDGRIEFRNSATGAVDFVVFGPKDPDREEICTTYLQPRNETNFR